MTEFLVQPTTDGLTGKLGWKTISGMTWRKVALGRNGTTHNKTEGDGATPFGSFPIRWVYYRPDRIAPPQTELPVRMLTPDDGWCDAPQDSFYNRPVKLPHPASCESLWRDDHLYDLIVVIGHNDSPVIPGKGSAIFVHLAKDEYAPTEGCVALTLDDLQEVISVAKPGDRLKIFRD